MNVRSSISVIFSCNLCKSKTTLSLDEKKYSQYRAGAGKVQQLFPELNDFARETIISGMCFKCQSKVFNKPMPGDESWGSVIGECEVCGAPIYEKDYDGKSDYCMCPACCCYDIKFFDSFAGGVAQCS